MRYDCLMQLAVFPVSNLERHVSPRASMHFVSPIDGPVVRCLQYGPGDLLIASDRRPVPRNQLLNELSSTTGFASSSFPYFAVQPLVLVLDVEFPEVIPLPVEIGPSQIRHPPRT
jgi:hypothetical protein